MLEIRWHYADHGVRLAGQSDRFPQNILVPIKTIFPQLITENHYLIETGPVFLFRECASNEWLCLQDVEHIRGKSISVDSLRLAGTGQKVRFVSLRHRHIFKDFRALLPIFEIGHAYGHLISAALDASFPYRH